jgi:hypothetical protein
LAAIHWSRYPAIVGFGKPVALVVGGALLAHQLFAAVYCQRYARRYAAKEIERHPEDGVGKPIPCVLDGPFISRLIEQGYTKYKDFDLEPTIGLLLEPHRSTMRITEEIFPTDPVATHRVTKELRLSAEPTAAWAVPVADFPKGMLPDALDVTIDSKPAHLMSYDESLYLVASLVVTCRLSEFVGKHGTVAAGFLHESFQENRVPRDVRAATQKHLKRFRNDVLRDMYEITKPAVEITATDRKDARSRGIVSGRGKRKIRAISGTDALIAKLTVDYALFAIVDAPASRSLRVEYSRATSLHGIQVTQSKVSDRRREARFRLSQFPPYITILTSLMYKCSSYHLRLSLPPGLFVDDHEIYRSHNGGDVGKRLHIKEFIESRKVIRWKDDGEAATPTYMRARDHRALPNAHFYARNGHYLRRIDHLHVINVSESPFATLRLATTLLLLATLGLIIAAVSMTFGPQMYNLRGGAIAVVVSVPGILASWSRQTFGIEALQRACLTTQIALRLTTALSLSGLALAVCQEVGMFHWRIELKLFGAGGPTVPVKDGFWACLCLVATVAAVYVYARYIKRRTQYLTLRRRVRFSEGRQ